MTFLQPEVLLLLSALPLLWASFRDTYHLQAHQRALWVQEPLQQSLLVGISPRLLRWCDVLLACALLALIIALARPCWGMGEMPAPQAPEVVIAVDTSKSMLAQDIAPHRLERSKQALRLFLEALKGYRVGLVAFAGEAQVISPLTADLSSLAFFSQNLQVGIPQAGGTDLGKALAQCREVLATGLGLTAEDALRLKQEGWRDEAIEELARRNRYPFFLHAAHEEELRRLGAGTRLIAFLRTFRPPPDRCPTQTIVLITDGEDHGQQTAAATGQLKQYGIPLFICAVGTTKGSPIPWPEAATEEDRFVRDAQGKIVISAVPQQTLDSLASQTAGICVHLPAGQLGLDLLARKIQDRALRDGQSHGVPMPREQWEWPLLVGYFLWLSRILIEGIKI